MAARFNTNMSKEHIIYPCLYDEILYDEKIFQLIGGNEYSLKGRNGRCWLFRLKGSEFVYNSEQEHWFEKSFGELLSFETVFSRVMESLTINNEIKERIIFHLDELRKLKGLILNS